MSNEVAPTLELMSRVYRAPLDGGPDSERFRAYVGAAALGAPVHGYNPMTSKPVLRTIEGLLDMRAEERLAVVADDVAHRLGYDEDEVMHITVATPGLWTDRIGTEVEHRLLAKDPAALLLWFDDALDPRLVDAACAAQTARLITLRRRGVPTTLADAVHQEGHATRLAGDPGSFHPAAAEALEVLGDDPSLSTKVAFLYGDDAARHMGFTPLGLDDRVGYRHAAALAQASSRPR